jgi:hypothetical protein
LAARSFVGQLQKTEEAAKSGGVLVLGGDEIASKLQETLIDNKKLERKIGELNTVTGQLRGQIKVLEAKLKDAALAQQTSVPEAILQLRGRWSSSDSGAADAKREEPAASTAASGGVGIGMGIGGSSNSEVLQLRAEIEKCVQDMQRYPLPPLLLTCSCRTGSLQLLRTLDHGFTLGTAISSKPWIPNCMPGMITVL